VDHGVEAPVEPMDTMTGRNESQAPGNYDAFEEQTQELICPMPQIKSIAFVAA
jgi:hypothetical protein